MANVFLISSSGTHGQWGTAWTMNGTRLGKWNVAKEGTNLGKLGGKQHAATSTKCPGERAHASAEFQV